MKKLLKMLFVFPPEEIDKIPLSGLEAISYFRYQPIPPAFIEACVKNDVRINLLHPDGRYISSITSGGPRESLLLRKQHNAAIDPGTSIHIARNMIMSKIFNSRWVVGRMYRDYSDRLDSNMMNKKSVKLKDILGEDLTAKEITTIREIKKKAAGEFYAAIDDMIVYQRKSFIFNGRSSKPPLDPVNSMLSFAYELLEIICTSALKTTGFDTYTGFFYMEKPNRESLVLDLMEEFKACIADRFVLTLINEKKIKIDDFEEDDEGSLVLTKDGKDTFLMHWQEFLGNKTIHPYLEEDVEWGMLPYASAMLLSLYLRGEIDKYPAFLRQKVGM